MSDNNTVLFYKPEEKVYGVFSQWSPTPFKIDSIEFLTSEHYMMYQKALSQGDIATSQAILREKDPRMVFRLGQSVTPPSQPHGAGAVSFDTEKWDAVSFDAVLAGNRAKFAQNAEARRILLATGDREIVEASAHDAIWGIGFAAKDALMHRSEWGENKLGRILMQVRQELKSSNADHAKTTTTHKNGATKPRCHTKEKTRKG